MLDVKTLHYETTRRYFSRYYAVREYTSENDGCGIKSKYSDSKQLHQVSPFKLKQILSKDSKKNIQIFSVGVHFFLYILATPTNYRGRCCSFKMAEMRRVENAGRALLLTSILDFANATQYSRCYEEAELLLQAGHLFLCGKTTSSEDKVNIFALCLATSAVRGDPHEINVELVAGNDEYKYQVERAACSCVAGPSECCKHTVAALLHCNRYVPTNGVL